MAKSNWNPPCGCILVNNGLVIHIIKETNPDVVCLLDVNKLSWETLRATLESTFVMFQVFLEEGNKSGIVLCCNRSLFNKRLICYIKCNERSMY
jgi:hypothetical protein